MNLDELPLNHLMVAAAGNPAEAEAILAVAVARFPEDAKAAIAYAARATARQDWPEALSRWAAVATRFKDRPEGPGGAAKALVELRRFDDASAVLESARRLFPDDRLICVMSGWVATERKDIAAAEPIWRDVRTRFPGDASGFTGGAKALGDAGRLAEAEAILLEGMERFPDSIAVVSDLAWIAHHQRNWPLLIERWRDVVARFPDAPSGYIGLGEAMITVFESDPGAQDFAAQAKALFAQARQRFADDARVAAAFAHGLVRLRDWPAAIAAWQDFIARFPADPAGPAGLGAALREAGDLAASIGQLERAAEVMPDDFRIGFQLALSVSEQRDWPRALKLWEALKRRDPSNGDIRSELPDALWKARQDQALAEDDPAVAKFEIPEILLRDNDATGEERRKLTELFMGFESIGSGCEFGLVQRRFDANPLSLLRWSAIWPDPLTKALDAQFAGVGDAEHTMVFASNGEYLTEDRRYYMLSHTFTLAASEPLETFAEAQLRRLRFLRRKLLKDLAAAEKILVYKANDGITEFEINALYQALQRYSPQISLLCVRLADAEHPPGTLDQRSAHLFVGYADRFSNVDPPVDNWVSLCQRVAAAVPARLNLQAVA